MGGFFDFGLGGGCGGRTCHKNLVIVTASTNSNWQVEKLNVTFPLMDAFSDEEVDMVSFGGAIDIAMKMVIKRLQCS
jgi:CobQ-like glutamine amidotransferase family enzyme